MKTCCTVALLTAATLWSGCAFSQRGMVLEPVGPSPEASGTSTAGTLVVFSAFDVTAPGIGDFEHRHHYSDYKILSEDGTLLQAVPLNDRVGTVVKEATRVQLPPGKYRVAASSNGYETVIVPVVIAMNRTTMVHLDGGYSWASWTRPTQPGELRAPA